MDVLIIVIRTAASHATDITFGNENSALVQHALKAPVGVPLPSYTELLDTVTRQLDLQIQPTTLLSDPIEHRLMIETLWIHAEFTRFSRQAHRRVALNQNKWKALSLQLGNAAEVRTSVFSNTIDQVHC